MLRELQQIFDEGGRLQEVSRVLFQRDPAFVTAIYLRFETLTAVFRAQPDDDTLAVTIGPCLLDEFETIVADQSACWSRCLGNSVCWAWMLTNHQGYNDGVRLEFSESGGPTKAIIELVVIASAIRTYEIEELRNS